MAHILELALQLDDALLLALPVEEDEEEEKQRRKGVKGRGGG